MGKIEVTRRFVGWEVTRRLVLTNEDYALREKRRESRQEDALNPRIFGWHRRFVNHLEPCPYCGKQPLVNCIWKPDEGYSYKLVCNGYPHGMLECGDWYEQLSRAGLDWNYRVRHERGEPLRHCPHWEPDIRRRKNHGYGDGKHHHKK